MVRRENGPKDLGRKATDARRSQQEMYESLDDLREAAEEGSLSKDELEDKIGNIEDRFGIFIESAEEDYDTVSEFADSFADEFNSINFHYHEGGSEDSDISRRKLLGYTVGGAAAATGGVGIIGTLLGWGDTGSGQTNSQTTKASITNVDQIGSYLEDRVIGNEMLSAEANWGDLLSDYDSESGEFFPESDRSLEGIDVTLDPSNHSEYGLSMGINGESEYETRVLREDKAAEDALEYFGEL